MSNDDKYYQQKDFDGKREEYLRARKNFEDRQRERHLKREVKGKNFSGWNKYHTYAVKNCMEEKRKQELAEQYKSVSELQSYFKNCSLKSSDNTSL
jgi:hypothetical protein